MGTARIFLITASGSEWTSMVETPYDQEDILQAALAQYPDLLPGDQINPEMPRRWLLVQRELGIPGEEGGGNVWSLDHLFLDQDGIPTFVECKRAADTRTRREVVAQMLDYAANGTEYWPMDRLRQSAAETARQQERALDDEILQLIDSDEVEAVDAYWEKVEQNLRNGRIRLIFVADRVPAELRRLVEFLNAKMQDVEVLAVEVKQFLGQGQKAMVPRVIGQTEASRRGKAGASSGRLTTPFAFLKQHEPGADALYRAVWETAVDHGCEINWGTKGFSIRFQYQGRKISFAYGYPGNIFDLYLGYLPEANLDQATIEQLRQQVRVSDAFVERGRNTLRAHVTAETDKPIREAFTTAIRVINAVKDR